MKKLLKIGSIILALLMMVSVLFACTPKQEGGGDVDIDDEGNVRPGGGGITDITFWGYGDNNEIGVFRELVAQFNELYKDTIHVTYEVKANDDYKTTASSGLRASRPKVDVLYVGDSDFKSFAELGYLESLDSWIASSTEINLDEMWPTSVNRFKYDVNTTTQDGPDAHYWGIPKDIGPTVVYYNETYFNNAGVKVISVAADKLADFNGGAADSRGKTKAQYGIPDGFRVQEKGYFVDSNNQKWFNNQIPMSWGECVVLSTLVQNDNRSKYGKDNIYGYHTEWWFNYGWSVGGDCIEYVATNDAAYNGGYWDFTLMDPTDNFIVADDNTAGFDVGGNHYNAGEIISWQDKLVDSAATNKTVKSDLYTAVSEGKLNKLPSQRDAFIEFIRVGQKTTTLVEGDMYGYGICPAPTSVGGDAGKVAAFSNGQVAMLVDGRWSTVNYRATMDGKYDWDVAPLPQYKEYYAAGDAIPAGKEVGDVKVHGIEAAHSGSVALCINAKSQKKNAAWKFAEYIGGRTGQTAQAESGFAIPSQMDLANSEVFLQSNKNPRNSIVFVRAAAYETPGDWWYLRDKMWIDDWAGVLNGDVRNGKLTLSQFETHEKYLKTWEILKTYTKK